MWEINFQVQYKHYLKLKIFFLLISNTQFIILKTAHLFFFWNKKIRKNLKKREKKREKKSDKFFFKFPQKQNQTKFFCFNFSKLPPHRCPGGRSLHPQHPQGVLEEDEAEESAESFVKLSVWGQYSFLF